MVIRMATQETESNRNRWKRRSTSLRLKCTRVGATLQLKVQLPKRYPDLCVYWGGENRGENPNRETQDSRIVTLTLVAALEPEEAGLYYQGVIAS